MTCLMSRRVKKTPNRERFKRKRGNDRETNQTLTEAALMMGCARYEKSEAYYEFLQRRAELGAE